jgi:lysophospholipase L1-like esterase
LESGLPHQVGAQLQCLLGGSVRLLARGASGATIRQVAEHQVAALAGVDADAVVISAGVNDAVARRSQDQVAGDTRQLLAASEAAWPNAVVVVVACPDLRHAPGLPWPINLLVSRSTRRVCQAQQRAASEVPVVVLPRPARATFAVDGFHPAPATLRLIGALACGALLPGLRPRRRPHGADAAST